MCTLLWVYDICLQNLKSGWKCRINEFEKCSYKCYVVVAVIPLNGITLSFWHSHVLHINEYISCFLYDMFFFSCQNATSTMHYFVYDKNNIFRSSFIWFAKWNDAQPIHVCNYLHTRRNAIASSIFVSVNVLNAHTLHIVNSKNEFYCFVVFLFLRTLSSFCSSIFFVALHISQHPFYVFVVARQMLICTIQWSPTQYTHNKRVNCSASARFSVLNRILPSLDHFNPFRWIIDVVFYAFEHWYENIVSICFLINISAVVCWCDS